MVRRPEINIVKVDRVPDGERIIVTGPEAPPLLSEQANRNLARYTAPADKAVVRPVTQRRGQQPPLQAVASPRGSAPSPKLPEIPANLRKKPAPGGPPGPGTPPHTQTQTQTQAPHETSPAAVATVTPITRAAAPPRASLQDYLVPEPLPELSTLVVPSRPRLLPIAMGVAGAVMVGSGIYLFLQGQSVLEKSRSHSGRPSVSLSSAAKPVPARFPELQSLPARDANGAPATALASSSPTKYTDQVHHEAMAPERHPATAGTSPDPQDAPMTVRTRRDNIRLRSGPGTGYPVVAIVDENTRLVVTDWSANWFKVQLPEMNDPNEPHEYQALPRIAWVPTEVVQVIPGLKP